MPEETPKRRIQKLRYQHSRKLRQTVVQLGGSLLRSRGIALPAKATDRERMAQIEAYKDLIQSKTRELEDWTQRKDNAVKRGMTKQAQFRQQMIIGMENQLGSYEKALRRLQCIPGLFWNGST